MKPQVVIEANTPDLAELKKYVEPDVELPKVELVHRLAGKAEPGLLNYIKCLVFHHAVKQGERVYLV